MVYHLLLQGVSALFTGPELLSWAAKILALCRQQKKAPVGKEEAIALLEGAVMDVLESDAKAKDDPQHQRRWFNDEEAAVLMWLMGAKCPAAITPFDGMQMVAMPFVADAHARAGQAPVFYISGKAMWMRASGKRATAVCVMGCAHCAWSKAPLVTWPVASCICIGQGAGQWHAVGCSTWAVECVAVTGA